ncbi:nucleotidyltransferase [Bacillus sp. M6-12]|uniref:nucleotidyltransferase n=1 Tax=Bacillus sp. M6-12 TaxID=2054166 RepID=UPI000C773E93|nr:nucleotidyltransferase [Bacillus sp. M6-12]PLS16576.1 nucleotidyltransferase [Bacillus sp. M6-12]
MNALGVIVEYNPFHNGHAYHLRKSKEAAGADLIAAVMSGPFLQRGEPALISKWARAEMALSAGADLIIELPYKFASQKAEIFAEGAVAILQALKCESFCFGSEQGSIETFVNTYQFLASNRGVFNQKLKFYMEMGNSFPKANALAFKELGPSSELLDLSQPNNILGYQYVSAALSHKYPISPLTIQRTQAGYHDTELTGNPIASATGIRKALLSGNSSISEIEKYVPASTKEILTSYFNQYRTFHYWELYWPFLKYRIMTASVKELQQIYEVEEGIEYRLKEFAAENTSFQGFMEDVKTKRYTWTRLQRICVHILTNTKKEEMRQGDSSPEYIRLLGMNDRGRRYLQHVKKNLELPLISKIGSIKGNSIDLDIRAGAVHSLCLRPQDQSAYIKREYLPPVIM